MPDKKEPTAGREPKESFQEQNAENNVCSALRTLHQTLHRQDRHLWLHGWEYTFSAENTAFKRRNKLEINAFYASCTKKNSRSNSIQRKEQSSFQKSPFTGKGASLQGVWTEKYTAPSFLFIVIQAVNSLIPNATRHTHNLLFRGPDLCFISKVQHYEEKKKRGMGGREKQQWQQATETLFHIYFFFFLYEAGARECGKEFFRNFPMGRKKPASFGGACIFTH